MIKWLNGLCAQLAYDRYEEVKVGRGGTPVADRRSEGHSAAVDGAAGKHPAVVEQRLAEAAVDIVQLWLGQAGRVVAKADDVEWDLGWKVQEGSSN